MDLGVEVCSDSLGHMAKMGLMLMYNKTILLPQNHVAAFGLGNFLVDHIAVEKCSVLK